MYKLFSVRCGIYSEEEKDKITVRYYESSIIEDENNIIDKYSLEDKTGKEILNFLTSNKINFPKLSAIYNDWYLYKSNQIIGTCSNLV